MAGILGVAGWAAAQSTCDPQLGACVRELPQAPRPVVQESWYQDMPDTSNGAWVRELPEGYTPQEPRIEWGWDILDVATDLPPIDPIGGQCARSMEQALSWLAGPSRTQDEKILNRALSAYQWKGSTQAGADPLIDWIANWPLGGWEQQVGWDETGEQRSVARFRYATADGHVHAWVRAIRDHGCWFLVPSPPKPQPDPSVGPEQREGWTHHEQGTEAQLPNEPIEQQGNLMILWEAPEVPQP